MSICTCNVLIIDDSDEAVEELKNRLNKILGKAVKVFPDNINRDKNLYNLNEIIDLVRQRKFQEVLNVYNRVNYFVIDICLQGSTDKLGEEFREAIKMAKDYEYDKDYRVILISNGKPEGSEKSDEYVSKIAGGKAWMDEVVEKIRVRISNNQSQIPNTSSGDESEIRPIRKIVRYFSEDIKVYGWETAFHFLINVLLEHFRRSIDKVIRLSFFLLIIASTIYGTYEIIFGSEGFYHIKEQKVLEKSIDTLNVPNDAITNINIKGSGNDPNIKNDLDETKVLKTAEEIFIYLLPIFIIFGFFNYYKNNIRISFLEGNENKINEGNSTSAIRMTKTLFVSSIIAYLLIKVTEELFTNTKSPSLLIVLSSIFLLIILMIFFIVLERENHKSHK